MTTRILARLVRWWTWVYTAPLPLAARAARRAEIDSDRWESLADPGASRDLLPRLLLGLVDDLAWSVEHMDTTTRASAWWSGASLFTVTASWLWLTYVPESAAMRESFWAFPIAMTFHLLGLVVLVGAQGVLASRLTGHAFGDVAVSAMVRHVTPWTAVAAVVTIVSGLALYGAEPAELARNLTFRLKLVALLLVLVNVWYTHAVVLRRAHDWDHAATPPAVARASAYVSLTLWALIIVAGRLTSFF